MWKIGQKDKTGFTLIEMLVSIFIIMLITTVFVVNYNKVSKSSELSIVAQKLISDIRLAQNQALGLSEFNSAAPNGWGLYVTDGADQYIIFADIDSDDKFNDSSPLTEMYKTVALPAGVSISLPSINRYDILFIPPEPTTKITENGSSASSSATIILTDGSNTKNVFVNSFGLVE